MIATTEFPPGVAPSDEMKSRSCDELREIASHGVAGEKKFPMIAVRALRDAPVDPHQALRVGAPHHRAELCINPAEDSAAEGLCRHGHRAPKPEVAAGFAPDEI